jgi:hypothetical protein
MAKRAISAKRHERAAVRSDVLKFDITKDWEARGPARALFEDTSARAIEQLHGFEVGRDTRNFARWTDEANGEAEIHIVSADAEDRARQRDILERARKVHIVEHHIEKPELDAAKRVQSAWSTGAILPPRQGDAPGHAPGALPAHEDAAPAPPPAHEDVAPAPARLPARARELPPRVRDVAAGRARARVAEEAPPASVRLLASRGGGLSEGRVRGLASLAGEDADDGARRRRGGRRG